MITINILLIILWVTIFIFVNLVICMIYNFTRPIGERVDPQFSACFFPLFIHRCKQYRYETIDDKVNRWMK